MKELKWNHKKCEVGRQKKNRRTIRKGLAVRKQVRCGFKPSHFNTDIVNETETSFKRKRLPERIKRQDIYYMLSTRERFKYKDTVMG